jgi:hypothetical protein
MRGGKLMFYCEDCMLVNDEPVCPRCRAKKLRCPEENDIVYLLTREALYSGGIEEILKENGIPCLKRGVQGAGITERLGYSTETYEFFVPYGAYEKAKEIIKDILDIEL